MCNPPFHGSLAEADAGSQRKRKNLGLENRQSAKLNFGGQKAELWCAGGELAFIGNIIGESKQYAHQVLWFTSLVSKSVHLKPLKSLLKKFFEPR